MLSLTRRRSILRLPKSIPTTVPINSFSNPFPTGVLEPVGRSSNYLSVINGQPVVTNVPKEPATYAEQWNLDVEKDLGHQTVFDIAYVGNHGVHQQLPAGLNDNGQGLDQLPDQYNSMGSALTVQVPNPFYGLITTGNLSGADDSRRPTSASLSAIFQFVECREHCRRIQLQRHANENRETVHPGRHGVGHLYLVERHGHRGYTDRFPGSRSTRRSAGLEQPASGIWTA